MATTTKILATATRYGYFDNAAYTHSGHLYVGKNPDTGNVYSARATFPSLRSIETIGDANIIITKVTFVVRRDAGTKASTITVGPSADGNWGAVRDGTASLNIPAQTAWYTFDITHCAEAILNYSNSWYVHLTGTGTQARFDGSDTAGGEPIIYVTWEYANSTITTGTDSTTLGNTVNFTITPEEDYYSYNLSYEFGSQTGIITSGTTATNYSWTPPLNFANEIPNSLTGDAKVTMHVFNSAGIQIRTEILYVTLNIPESMKIEIIPVTYSYEEIGSVFDTYLAGKTSLGIAPMLSINNSYGATIKSFTAEINNEGSTQLLTWNTFYLDSESDAIINPQGYYMSNSQTTNIFQNAGSVSITFTAIDSRGLINTVTKTYTVHPYSEPVIHEFNIERYEAVYDEETGAVSEYVSSDIGERVWVTLVAECAPILVDDMPTNELRWIITAKNSDGTTKTYNGGGEATFVDYSNNRTLININVPTSIAVDYTLQVYDNMNYSAYQYASVALGRANFALATSKFGAGFGCLPKGTEEEPMLESTYPIYAYGGMSFTDESSENSQIIRFFRGTETERDEHNKQNGDIWFVTLGGN